MIQPRGQRLSQARLGMENAPKKVRRIRFAASAMLRWLVHPTDILYDFHFCPRQRNLRLHTFLAIAVVAMLYGIVNTMVFGRSEARVSLECAILIGAADLLIPLLTVTLSRKPKPHTADRHESHC